MLFLEEPIYKVTGKSLKRNRNILITNVGLSKIFFLKAMVLRSHSSLEPYVPLLSQDQQDVKSHSCLKYFPWNLKPRQYFFTPCTRIKEVSFPQIPPPPPPFRSINIRQYKAEAHKGSQKPFENMPSHLRLFMSNIL